MNTRITAVGTAFPKELVKTEDIFAEVNSEQYGFPTTWIKDVVGIESCYMTPMGENPSVGAIAAANKVLEQVSHVRDKVDLLIFVGIEGDTSEPATAHIIQSAIGTNAQIVFDVKNACYGFTQAMMLADNLMKTGTVKCALVVTGEISTQVVRHSIEEHKKNPDEERFRREMGFYTGGDGAGAVLLEPSFSSTDQGFVAFKSHVDSTRHTQCAYTLHPKLDGIMDMKKMTFSAIRMYSKINQLYNAEHLTAPYPNPDYLVSHQTGLNSYEFLTNMVQPDKLSIETYKKHGNLTTATFPVSFEKLLTEGSPQVGDRMAGIFGGSGIIVGKFEYII